MLKDRSTWGIAGAKVLSDATWWLLLFWMPDFMNRQYGLTGVELGGPLALAYTGAAVGSLVSGTMATRLLSTGMPVNHVRKGIMLVCGLMVLVLPLALLAPNPWIAAGILAVVLAAHQGFSTNLFALITDVTPTVKVGRVTSFAAFCGNIGGMGIVWTAGCSFSRARPICWRCCGSSSGFPASSPWTAPRPSRFSATEGVRPLGIPLIPCHPPARPGDPLDTKVSLKRWRPRSMGGPDKPVHHEYHAGRATARNLRSDQWPVFQFRQHVAGEQVRLRGVRIA
jgi:hypothetical protein